MSKRILQGVTGLILLALAFGAVFSGRLSVGKPGLDHEVTSGNAEFYFWFALFVGGGLWQLGKAILAEDDTGPAEGPGDVDWD